MDVPGSPACLAVHGLGGGPYELQPLADALRAKGRRVAAPTLPGHDGPGPVMPASTWADWTGAAEGWYDELAQEPGPVSVVGFSTGALIALHLASRRPVARLVLIAPFLAIRYTAWLPFRASHVLRAVAPLVPDLRRRAPAVRDPEARGRLAALDRYRTFSLPAALSALELIEAVAPTLPAIAAPVLIIQGALDTVVEPARAAWLRDRLGSRVKRLVMLDRSDHLALHDRDRDRAIAEAVAFLDEPMLD
ncbi:alpha/beta hydrolase [Paludisphaera mucosa]|uniref:Alpha/beta fold hydrolase n=1 Tax=Paludisphaera mucosa TaxID=3030827 RepID=A0ABT6F3P4_9BACT|nr:alpha/beta fold hydrolase [Paludisphaera mucosa]MDG3002198.1 alpha/beta fold hydrolase [Paludisphaera mucosa]